MAHEPDHTTPDHTTPDHTTPEPTFGDRAASDGAASDGAASDRPALDRATSDRSASGYIDGNGLAGPLGELLAVDATTGWWRCPECRRSGPVAQLHVYGPEPGLTARCPGCAHVALRLVRSGDHLWLSMGSPTDTVRFPVAGAAAGSETP